MDNPGRPQPTGKPQPASSSTRATGHRSDLHTGTGFFDREASDLAVALLGRVLRHRIELPSGEQVWLAARIIETEAYYRSEKGSHSSLGYTDKRKAMFMPPGTIYMYYARGRDSLNFSARGPGNAVLVKSAWPWFDDLSPRSNLRIMQALNPGSRGPRRREKLCNGQTLLCRSLGLRVPEWNRGTLDPEKFRLEDVQDSPVSIIQAKRLGIPDDRDSHLLLRFIDHEYARYCTRNPLTARGAVEGQDYVIRQGPGAINAV